MDQEGFHLLPFVQLLVNKSGGQKRLNAIPPSFSLAAQSRGDTGEYRGREQRRS